jgi:hypothetical protein
MLPQFPRTLAIDETILRGWLNWRTASEGDPYKRKKELTQEHR